MSRLKLLIEYQGTRYRGWQEQANARTVQGELRRAAETLLGERPEIVGAGRTDAGVHALGQVAHLRARNTHPAEAFAREMNDLLPADINILAASDASPQFHARHDALERFYLYQISRRRRAFAKPFVWWVRDRLDAERMKAAAALLPGRHDFAAFCDKGGADKSTLVEVTRAELAAHGELILFRIGASHFLWKMVRRIAGVLVQVGRGSLAPEDIEGYFAAPSSTVAEWTAPPSGLFLESVRYEGEPAPRGFTPAFFFK